ncbi:MAG: cytochrome P450 [Chloroflexi bacterium]|nr:MAG: cytochrome P450 [Chloroflexota bacterium]
MTTSSGTVIDLAHPDHYANGIPYDVLAELRRTSPVVWIDEPATGAFAGGPGYWAVLRHADVSHVSRHPEDFSSWRGTSFLRDPRPADVAVLRRMMLNMDPPEHSKLRKIVNRAFTPQAIRRQLADAIDRHAREAVDAVCERGEIDFLTAVAAEMPLLVLADVLGVPGEDRGLLYSWTNRLVGLDDPEYGADPRAFVAAFTEMFAYARARTREKRANPADDIWSTIANAEVDGDRLSDDDLDRFFQLLVIAGNDTTRNLIANTLLTLSQHSDQLARLRADLSLLPGTIEEVLRFSPSVVQFRRTATRELELGGQRITENDKVLINYASANRDEDVFDEPDRFDITRDPNPHISFGDGTHFCLGANLARTQTRALLTELFTRLPDIEVSGPPERMRSSFMNAIKHLPARFTPVRRADAPIAIPVRGPAPAPAAASEAGAPAAGSAAPAHGMPLLVLFGSNFGTSEDVARQIADAGSRHGFDSRVAPLDAHVGDLPREGVVAIATATYNGTPPDNAVAFARWLSEDAPDLTGVAYSVFGCGNREWAPTFQDFPRFVDGRMAELGARRLHARGEGDAAGDFDGEFESWDNSLWPALGAALGIDVSALAPSPTPRYRIEFVPGSRQSPFVTSLAAVDRVGVNQVRHIELALPDGLHYDAGDHLGVIPHNSEALVARVVRRFGLDPDAHIRLHSDTGTADAFLPVGERLSVRRLLSDYVELQDVASRRDIATLLQYTEYPWTRERLEALLDPADEGRAYRDQVLACHRSVLDLLEEHPTCRLPLPIFLQLLAPLAPRYYSISSSSRVNSRVCSITVGALHGPARSGRGDYHGVCSNYLFGQEAEEVVYAFVRDTASSFRLPADPARPVIMIGSGTGIAPFRGFLAERAALCADGVRLGPGLMLFGCRHPQADLLYAGEIEDLAHAANVQLACAFSRVPGLPRVYVQDRLLQMGEMVWSLLDQGGTVLVCGSTHMADGVRRCLAELHRERTGSDAATAEGWLRSLSAASRYLVDVWASG